MSRSEAMVSGKFAQMMHHQQDQHGREAAAAQALLQQIAFLGAQATQFRQIIGILVDRLGGEAVVRIDDFRAMADRKVEIAMSNRPAPLAEDGSKRPDELHLRILTSDEAKKLAEDIREAQPRVIAPNDVGVASSQQNLILP